MPDATVNVTTTDDDGVGFSIAEINSTVVSENGTTDEFTVVLDAQPQAGTQVVLLIASRNTAEATVDPANLTFTPANWSVPQVVEVTGVDDSVVDGDQVTAIDISVGPTTTDPAFATLPDASVNVTAEPSACGSGVQLNAAVGPRSAIVTTCDTVSIVPSSSVTVRLTVYVPSSS